MLNKQTFILILRGLLQTAKAQWVTFLKSLQREFSHSIFGKLFKEVIYNCSPGNFSENTKVKYEVLSYQEVKNTVVILSVWGVRCCEICIKISRDIKALYLICKFLFRALRIIWKLLWKLSHKQHTNQTRVEKM